MFFVRSEVRHTGFELTQADDALLLAPQAARFQNTQPLAYNLRRSPAQFSYQNCEPLPRSVIQPGLNCESHVPIVLQLAICMTHRNSGSERDFGAAESLSATPVGSFGSLNSSVSTTGTITTCRSASALSSSRASSPASPSKKATHVLVSAAIIGRLSVLLTCA